MSENCNFYKKRKKSSKTCNYLAQIEDFCDLFAGNILTDVDLCVNIFVVLEERFMEKQRVVYLDTASTTILSNEVYREMIDAYGSLYANPASIYKSGREADKALEKAKERIAKAIGAKAEEIVLTSGTSESNNLAIKGIAHANRSKGNHIITSVIEDESVLESCKALEKEGFKVTYIPVDENGVIKYSEIVKAMGPNTTLISIAGANGVVGTIQPIRAIAELARANDVVFHIDATYAIGMIDINVKEIGIGALTLSAHMFNGPQGVGALYVNKKVNVEKLIDGISAEDELRAGILNVPNVVAMGKAIEEATSNVEEKNRQRRSLRKYFLKRASESIHNISLLGHPVQRLQNNVCLSFEGAEAEAIALLLDKEGIYVHSCSSAGSLSGKPSYVLLSMGKDLETAESSVRFTFGQAVTKDDIDYVVEKVRKVVKKVRSISAIRIYKNKVEL